MKLDYHMHLEYGSYDETWAEGFFQAAAARGIDEIGFSEHSHTFPEFAKLYYDDLILDDSFIGNIQKKWLKKNKFKYTLAKYFAFMEKLKQKHQVKTGIEVCNFQKQAAVAEILAKYDFDYVIGSVHFIDGWGYDLAATKPKWESTALFDIYESYTKEIEKLCSQKLYDVLGHPFNIRLFRYLPDFDVTPFLERAILALKDAQMAIDVNTGTLYRYPIAEISPYEDFMRLAAAANIPIITTSDAHKPEDAGAYNDEAIAYAKRFGYKTTLCFTKRKRDIVPLG